jgi:hypothetical protein
MLWTLTGNSSLPFMQSLSHTAADSNTPWRYKRDYRFYSLTLQGYLKDRLDSVREIATVAMDEPNNGMNLAIFNAEGALLDDHQLEIVRNSYHTQKLSQAHIFYDQLVNTLIFWTGSSGCGVMESEKLQGAGHSFRKC